jgi:NADH-quinone oxidoreductase E subunit
MVMVKNKKFEFTSENKKEAEKTIAKYPSMRRFSAIMPLLTLAQKQNGGHLDEAVINYLAGYLNVTPMSLYEVANFYSMYSFNPLGKYHFQFCKSVVCLVTGGTSAYEFTKKLVGVDKDGGVSKDGLFSVKYVECLGACVNAPALKVNDIFIENVNEKTIKNLVNDLKQGKDLPVLVDIKKSSMVG